LSNLSTKNASSATNPRKEGNSLNDLALSLVGLTQNHAKRNRKGNSGAEGHGPKFGVYAVDLETKSRKSRKSAEVYKEIIKGESARA
jgi:hypothetical protein